MTTMVGHSFTLFEDRLKMEKLANLFDDDPAEIHRMRKTKGLTVLIKVKFQRKLIIVLLTFFKSLIQSICMFFF